MRNLIIGAVAAAAFVTAASVAGAAVYKPEQQLPASTVGNFKTTPASLLTDYPAGGPQMISRVRDLAASDPSTLPFLVNLLKGTLAPGQQNAIIVGLSQAARLALSADPAYATEIQTAVAASGNKDAADQFALLTGNAPTGAGAGGGAGGGGGGGSGAGGQTGSSGILFGGSNGSNNQTVARNSTTQMTQTSSGSVGGVGNSVSPSR